MSYDTSIIDPDTGAELADLGNMTSNVGGMYRRAMPGPYEGGGRYAGVGEPEPRAGDEALDGPLLDYCEASGVNDEASPTRGFPTDLSVACPRWRARAT